MKKRILILLSSLLIAAVGNGALAVAVLTTRDQMKNHVVLGLQKRLNADVEVKAVSYSLFGPVVIKDLSIYSRARKGRERMLLLRVGEARVEPNLFGVAGFGDVVDRVELEAVDLRLVREGAEHLDWRDFNWGRVIKEPEPGVEAEPISLPRLKIRGFLLRYEDRAGEKGEVWKVKPPPFDFALEPTDLLLGEEELHLSLRSHELGRVSIAVRMPGNTGEVVISTTGTDNLVRLDTVLHDLLPPPVQAAWDLYRPAGGLRIDAFRLGIKMQQGAAQPITLYAKTRLIEGRVRSALFPLPVSHLNGRIEIPESDSGEPRSLKNFLLKFNLKGKSDTITVKATGSVAGDLEALPRIEVNLDIQDALFNDAMLDAISKPDKKRIARLENADEIVKHAQLRGKAWERFKPAGGPFDVEVSITRAATPTADAMAPTVVDLMLHLRGNTSAAYAGFPYRLRDLKGDIRIGPSLVKILKPGTVGTTRLRDKQKPGLVTINGSVTTGGKMQAVDLDINLKDFPLDDDLKKALRTPAQKRAWKALNPSGRFNVNVRVRQNDSKKKDDAPRIDLAVTLDGRAAIRHEAFPADITNLRGRLEISNDNVSFRNDIVGSYRGVEVRGTGKMSGNGDAADVDITLEVDNLPLDKAFADLLEGESRKAWDMVRPSGTIQVEKISIRKAPGEKEVKVSATLKADGKLSFAYKSFPLGVHGVKGTIKVDADRTVTFDELKGRTNDAKGPKGGVIAGGRVILSKGRFRPAGNNATEGRLLVTVAGLTVTDAVFAAMPQTVRKTLKEAHFAGRIVLAKIGLRTTTLGGNFAGTEIDGAARLEGISVGKEEFVSEFACDLAIRKKHKSTIGQDGNFKIWLDLTDGSFKLLKKWPVRIARSDLLMENGDLRFGSISGTLGKGTIKDSTFVIDFKKGGTFRGTFSLSNAHFKVLKDPKAAKEKNTKDSGLVSILISAAGKLGDAKSIVGSGGVKIEKAEIWEVPILLSILNVLPNILSFRIPQREFLEMASSRFSIRDEKFTFRNVEVSSESINLSGTGRIGFDEKLRFHLKASVFRIPLIGEVPFLPKLFWFIVDGTLKEPKAHLDLLGMGG